MPIYVLKIFSQRMENLPPVLLDEVLLRAGFAAAREATKVSRAWRARAER
jgi:hypothetical protein